MGGLSSPPTGVWPATLVATNASRELSFASAQVPQEPARIFTEHESDTRAGSANRDAAWGKVVGGHVHDY